MIIYIVLAYVVPLPAAGPVEFVREKIRIDITPEVCKLTGNYIFRNTSKTAIQRALYYPFIVTDDLPFPESISVNERHSEKPVQFTTREKAVVFPLEIPGDTVVSHTVTYTQIPRSNRFEYILTTTARWSRPLQTADVVVFLANPLSLETLSFQPDSITHDTKGTYYYIHKKEFLPENNLTITWE